LSEAGTELKLPREHDAVVEPACVIALVSFVELALGPVETRDQPGRAVVLFARAVLVMVMHVNPIDRLTLRLETGRTICVVPLQRRVTDK
jgi:hypothetical protein